MRDVPPARWLLDLSELGGVLMSIVSGESTIGSTGLAMALNEVARENPITHDGSKRETKTTYGEN